MFKVHETHGVPLDTIIQVLEENNMIIDWIEFFEESLKCNWNIKTTVNKIQVSLLDLYGKEYSDEVIKRLKMYIHHVTMQNSKEK